jgi:hypothetical protein
MAKVYFDSSVFYIESGITATCDGSFTFNSTSLFVGAATFNAALTVSATGSLTIAAGGSISGAQLRYIARSRLLDLDIGAGVTQDDVILRHSKNITITLARIVYTDATTGTVAGGSAQIGTTVAGTQVVAATNYANGAAVGASTPMTIVSGAVTANTPVIVRHTGVAATQAGMAYVEIEYTINPT